MQELTRQREVGAPRHEGERERVRLQENHSSSDRIGEEKRHGQGRGEDELAP